ncbi:MAG: hypothetical protein DMG65_11670 [Candidatus Angelobacter sp. Gp1-AA117]|nr:MAG: hypothetical protein DMG65_11670 [Candidatus Angelobacter sp. Gp1-AA117]
MVHSRLQTASPRLRMSECNKLLEMVESGKPCTIRGLARRFNLTHYHLLHLFKQQMGISLGHLLTRQRLLQAASLLAESNIRIKEIAHEAGYEHTSSFARAFQRQFRMTPQRYREQGHSQEKLTKSAKFFSGREEFER